MRIYVDGRGLLQALAAGGSRAAVLGQQEQSRRNVARWLARYAERQDCEVHLVFVSDPSDGVASPFERRGRVLRVNLPAGADLVHEITGPANRAAATERVTVVTSDARLLRALERAPIRVLAPADFVARVQSALRGEPGDDGEPDEKFTGLSGEEVKYWLRFFQDEEK